MSLEKRVFVCFVLLVIFFCSGCSTVKHEWLPGDQPLKAPTRDKEAGGVQVDVLKVSF
jgi:hypothetical protein